MERLSIKIKDQDNVVVAVHDLPAGTTLESGVVTRERIPQAHKIALVDIPAGSWINEHMLDLPESPALTDMPWGTSIKPRTSCPPRPARPGWATATKSALPVPATCWAS